MHGSRIKRRKEVHVVFEYFDNSDLKVVLDVLREKLSEGIETYHNGIKVRDMEENDQKIEFVQFYQKTNRETVEREINGELQIVIKSKV